jgi:hypothetical protein
MNGQIEAGRKHSDAARATAVSKSDELGGLIRVVSLLARWHSSGSGGEFASDSRAARSVKSADGAEVQARLRSGWKRLSN